MTHTLSYIHKAKDKSENGSHTVSIFMDFNFQLDGNIVVKGTQIIITVTAKVQMGFHHHEVGIIYTDLPLRDYYNKTKIVTLDMAVSDDGKLTATQSTTHHNNSVGWDFDAKGIEGLFGLGKTLKNGLSVAQGSVDRKLKDAFDAFSEDLAGNFNQYHQWVFPGADTFVMSHVFFSDSCDLVTQLRYATPSMNGLVDEANLMISPVMQPVPPVVEEVTYNIAASAELMTNYIQSDILQPQKKVSGAADRCRTRASLHDWNGGLQRCRGGVREDHAWLDSAQLVREAHQAELPKGGDCEHFWSLAGGRQGHVSGDPCRNVHRSRGHLQLVPESPQLRYEP